MRTPLENYILDLRALRNVELYKRNEQASKAYGLAIRIAEDYKNRERRAIESAFTWGMISKVQHTNPITSGQEYYNKTFNTNEK